MPENKLSKIHPPLAKAVIQSLDLIFFEGRKASKAIEYILKSNKKWGSRDRSFIAENTYEIVRWWRLLHYINGTKTSNTKEGTLWSILGIHLAKSGYTVPDWKEFKFSNSLDVAAKINLANAARAIKHSIPDWIDQLGEEEFGNEWENQLSALNEQASVYIRVNESKTSAKDLMASLANEGINTEPSSKTKSALKIVKRRNLFASQAFKKGLFEVQDLGSQMIAPFLEVEAGMRIIDACAGAGGKTLHLGTLTSNKGIIIAMDTEEWKLKELKRRAKRQGLHNIETRHIASSKVIKRLKESADRLLLDVPCTGLGVLRRNPDAKWKIKPTYLEEVVAVQYDILKRYSQMLKPGGKMVYATCSILKQENQNQVIRFLKENENYQLEKEQLLSPYKNGTDGFYMALISKNP